MAFDMRRYENVLRKQTGNAIPLHRFDGYVNMVNRYGTKKDDTEAYRYQPEPVVDDMLLEMFYENNGLFAKIIDTPAEEAVKHGFELDDVEDKDLIEFYQSALDELDWEEVAMTGIKWARLFGGSLAIMLINDGHGLEEPLDWKRIRSIDDILVFDRSCINPDYASIYDHEPNDPFQTRGSRLGTPEWYEINNPITGGHFWVHDSRVLAFRNGMLPLNTSYENYRLWGIPEYVRINRAIRNAEVAHESAPKMLSKSVQPVYRMKDLAALLATEEGEDKVLRRLEAIDTARGLLNSITIDAEGEDYSFQTFGFTGVQEVIDASCNWLSAITSIPQTILFGRSPAGMNATGESDFENYYNYVERIQKRMLRSNLRYLLSVIFAAGLHTGEVEKVPEFKVSFNPLWSMSETEEVQLESSKLQNELTRANIANTYVGMEVLDPKEVRVGLGKPDDLDVESMLDDMSEEELMESAPQGQQGAEGGEGGMGGMEAMGGAAPQMGVAPQPAQGDGHLMEQGDFDDYAEYGNAPESAPEATKLPQDQEEVEQVEEAVQEEVDQEEEPDHEDDASGSQDDSPAVESDLVHPVEDVTSEEWLDDDILRRIRSVGVFVLNLKQMKILTGTRKDIDHFGQLCGPGGHVEPGESLTDAAVRETQEEFGITPLNLKLIGLGDFEEDTGLIPAVFFCTEYEGEMITADFEMDNQRFRTIPDIFSHNLFGPFKISMNLLFEKLSEILTIDEEGGIISMDGGPGSGNFGHGGRPGSVGGSSNKGSPSYQDDPPVKIPSKQLDYVIASGIVSDRLNKKKQNPHRKDSAEYNQRIKDGNPPSYTTVSDKELQSILSQNHGNGVSYGKPDSNTCYRETISAGKIVGRFYDRDHDCWLKTDRMTVHYAKDGCHFVPAKPKDYKQRLKEALDEKAKEEKAKAEGKNG